MAFWTVVVQYIATSENSNEKTKQTITHEEAELEVMTLESDYLDDSERPHVQARPVQCKLRKREKEIFARCTNGLHFIKDKKYCNEHGISVTIKPKAYKEEDKIYRNLETQSKDKRGSEYFFSEV
ncbi:hypothetical protein PoB_003158800 [Plakobranchus ocellatus]|uniref:Uncharacterized protein n=1 Tax=Plakobranchus ocellatus TaxID=259542 RepID=A0AAV4AEU6_9GAST|nr:hypothetical protein PoB_003158800 [Plakobranchus ocellatus]